MKKTETPSKSRSVGRYGTATQETDLGVIVTGNLHVGEQCAKVTKTANKVLCIIKWSYEDKSMANLLPF